MNNYNEYKNYMNKRYEIFGGNICMGVEYKPEDFFKGKMNRETVNNFISNMDLSEPMIDHFRNAMRDSLLYKWDRETRIALLIAIEDAYGDKTK